MKKDFSLTGFCISFYIILSALLGTAFLKAIALIMIAPTYIEALGTGEVSADISALQERIDMVTTGPAASRLAVIPCYIIAVPLVLKLLNGSVFHADIKAPDRRLSLCDMAKAVLIMFFLGVVGNLFGQLTVLIYGRISGISLENSLEAVLSADSLLSVFIFTVILAPVFEELLYRYGVISKIRKYGEYNAVVVSAVIFALIHRNIFQLFYTLSVGLVLGYVYTYTGRIRYSVVLHILFNFFGAFMPLLITTLSYENSMAARGYVIFEYTLAVLGLIVLIFMIRKRSFHLTVSDSAYVSGIVSKDSFLNPGMMILVILCASYSALLLI